MKIKYEIGARKAIVILEPGETQIDFPVLDRMTTLAMDHPAGLNKMDLIVPAGEQSSDELIKRHFRITGSVSSDATTKLVMTRTLSSPSFADTPRSAYLNPELSSATPAPVLQPTKEEKAAHANLGVSLEHHYSDDAVNRRLAAIEQDAAKFKNVRDEDKDIKAKANRMANAIARKPEPVEG